MSGATARLTHELGVIQRLGFPGYFLVVWDIVNFARDQDIMCQIRGSGADSAVCRCLGLTRVDPIRLGLPFERFLSEERGHPPDIDLDLEAERREEVIQYCYRRYGRERAAMVANVITYRARSVLKDVAKAFGFTPAQVDGMTRYVDTHAPAELHLEDPLPAGLTAELVYDICLRLDGFPRHLGIHSGGMVIADRPPVAGGPYRMGPHGGPHGAAMGQGRLCRHGDSQVRPVGSRHAERPAPHGGHHRRSPRPNDRPGHHPPGTGRVRDAHQGRHRGALPGRVQGADGHLAAPQTRDLLRPGRAGGVDPARPHPGRLGPPLPAPPQRGGAGPLPPSFGRTGPGAHPGGAGIPGATHGTGPRVRRFRRRAVGPAPLRHDPQTLGRGDGTAEGGGVRGDAIQGGDRRRRPGDLGESCRASPRSGFPRATRCHSPTSSTCRPGCATTTRPSSWSVCSTPSRWASTLRTPWYRMLSATGWWC